MLVERPSAQITNPSLIRRSFDFNLAFNPAKAAKPTTANEAVVAMAVEKSNKKIKIGTETIAPPAPTKPRTAPIHAPATSAINIEVRSTF